MTSPDQTDLPASELAREKAPSPVDAAAGSAEEQSAGEGASAEEQMARFEEDLKESDWGHQPC